MNRWKILRYTAYTLEIFLAFIIQSTPYLLPEIFDEKAVLLFPLAISIAVSEREIPCIILGMICGLLADFSYGGAIGFFGALVVILCYIVNRMMTERIQTNIFSVMLTGFIGIGGLLLIHFLFYYILAGFTNIGEFFVRHYIIRFLYTLVFVPLFYCLNRKISSKFQRRGL